MPSPRTRRQPALGKLRPPRLGRVVGRDRLFVQLDAAASVPGIWVTGPPGIGKTTLVASYLEARGIPCVWLQLDAGDADPATFVHFLRAAAALIAPRRQLRLPLPSADDLRDVPAFIRRCFRRLGLALDLPWALVLDNAQELASAPLLHAGMAAALAELPEQARVIALSREPPPPEYARALASQQLVVVDELSLRFTEDDTLRLVTLHGRDWSPAELRQLTGGWAAAMILLLATRTDLGLDEALRGGTAHERLFDFFAGEVMKKIGASDAAALMRIAYLPSASAAMAVAISGDAHAGELLADLARRSLFTDRRAGTPPAYTFHALFGEFLRARAVSSLGADALRALRVQAAGILAAHGHADAAIAELIAANAWSEALGLVVAHAARFVAQGRTAAVREWILAMPAASRASPQAWYWLGYCEMAVDPAQALQHFERAQRGFEAAGDAPGSFQTAAAAADAVVFIGTSLDALEPWMPVLMAHADTYLAQRDADTDLRVLPGLLAAFVYRQTAHALTAPLADLAERLLDQPLVASQRILLGTLAYYLLWTGQMQRLDRIIVKIDRLCAEPDTARATLLRWYSVGVVICSLLGRIDEALAQARSALALAGQGPAPMRAKAHLAMLLASVAARDAELARSHLSAAADAIEPGNAIDATIYEFQRGILMLLDGDWHNASKLMRAAVDSGRASGWPLREHIALLGQALAATQAGAFDEAEASLQAAFEHPFHAVCNWHHWIGALIEAQLAERRGNRARSLAALAHAFRVGRDNGYDFGPMPYCAGDMMPRLMLLALEHGIDPPFAQGIVRRYALPAPEGAGEHWPWPIRIRTLGRFVIERGDAPTAAPRKESRKPLDLLKLLIALGGQAVPVARLCAALWPEAEGDAARNSFDNALHRLRKLLGGEHFVPLRAGGLSLDAATCWTDLAALEARFAEIDSIGPAVSAEQLSALAEQALALCQGEFLAGDEDLPDVLVARTRIQARFTRQVAVLGARLEGLGQIAEAARLYERVVEQQPLAEDTVRRLIVCLLALGQRAKAYEAYRRCRQQLSVVLGMRPAPATEALVESLRDL
ncbi:MAG: BTAD domain-containing putative transcriptional regulator [Burkholderiales bacterium]